MKIIVGDRGTGKTHRMILWFMEDMEHRVILVPNMQQRAFVIRQIIRVFPEASEKPHTWRGGYAWEENIFTPSTLSMIRGRSVKEAYVDNVELLIRDMLGYRIPITLTSSEPMEVENLDH